MDQYGVSWQIMTAVNGMKAPQKVIPTLLFAGDICGRAEEAVNFYTSVFHNAKIGYLQKYTQDDPIETNAVVKHSGFMIEGFNMAIMDSGKKGSLNFKQGISFIVSCENQEEVDYYWDKLSADPKAEQCGWINDKFGVPWQIVPTAMERMISSGNKEAIGRVTQAFLKMKKFDIKKLEEAYEG